MSRRMMSPQVIIKSQVVDDKYQIDLNEILEKYGTVTSDDVKTITLQIYNKEAGDDGVNTLYDDSGILGMLVVNGSITITKWSGTVYINGMLIESYDNPIIISYLEIPSGSYENGINLLCGYDSDLYVIRV